MSSKLRHTLRAYASDGLEPATVMDKLERALDPGGSATCAYLLVDPAAETVTNSLAGHLPPFVVRPDGSVGMLSGGLSVPLAGLGIPRVQKTQSLPTGSTLVIYTDGLVERRNEPIDAGLRRLREAIAKVGSDPAELCELPRLLLEDGPHADDVALVAVRTALLPRTSSMNRERLLNVKTRLSANPTPCLDGAEHKTSVATASPNAASTNGRFNTDTTATFARQALQPAYRSAR